MSNVIQIRRGSNVSLPVLNAAEFGFATDTKQVYIGDGVSNLELVKQGDRYLSLLGTNPFLDIDGTPGGGGRFQFTAINGHNLLFISDPRSGFDYITLWNNRVGMGNISFPTETLDIAGNIAVSGTVDGRDISADLNQAVKTTDSPIFAGLAVDTNTLFVDKVNNRVGIGTAGPAYELDVAGFVNTKSLHKVSTEGLVLAMNFNSETLIGSKVLDSSINNNHGTSVGGATANPTGGFNGGGALSFDGVDDYVEVPDSASLDLTRYTVEAWINFITPGTDTHQQIVIKGGSSNENYAMFIHNTGRWIGHILIVNGVRDWFITPSGVVPLGEWTHVVISFDGEIARTFINGQERATLVKPGNTTPCVGPLSIGGLRKIQSFNGFIDEVRIYNRALSADEIKTLYLQRAENLNSYVSQGDVYVDTAGNVGIGTTTGSNILTIQQTSATDPIADAWTVYSTSKVKDIIKPVKSRGYLDKIINSEIVEYRRKLNKPKLQDYKDEDGLDKEDKVKKYQEALKEYNKKLTLKKFKKINVGVIADAVTTPAEILAYDEDNKVQGIDLGAYTSFLHAGLKELEQRLTKLEAQKWTTMLSKNE